MCGEYVLISHILKSTTYFKALTKVWCCRMCLPPMIDREPNTGCTTYFNGVWYHFHFDFHSL